MNKVLLIAWREFRDTVFTWAFALSILSLPVLSALMIAITPLMESSGDNMFRSDVEGIIVVVEADDAMLLDAMRTEAEGDSDYEGLTFEPASGDSAPQLARLRDGELLGVIAPGEKPRAPKRSGQVAYLSPELELRNQREVRDLVAAAEARLRIAEQDLDPVEVRQLTRNYLPKAILIGEEGEAGDTSTTEHAFREATGLLMPVMGMSLLWMGTFVSAQYLLQNTMEERSSKVIEVMLSAVSPMQLMTGKIIGLGLVGGLLTTVYGSSGIAILIVMAFTDLLHPVDVVLYVLFYIQAYLVLGSFFAAVGSAVTEIREAQSLMTPAVMLMMVPMLLILPMMDEPNGTTAMAASWVPLMTPFVMAFRVLASEPVAAWEILGTLVWGGLVSAACVWASARIFRVGVLMQGKAPTFRELATWIFRD